MIDSFALLAEPRRPWLDPDLLKQKFLTLAAGLHPDRFHNAGELEKAGASRRYADLNAAYHCLAAPKSRLRHLLELELGAKPKDIQQIPAAPPDSLEAQTLHGTSADAVFVPSSQLETMATLPGAVFRHAYQTLHWATFLDGVVAFRQERPPTSTR